MSFLQPLLLLGLPLALAPVIIHLIHQLRRRQIPWAAMMFLLAAQRMHKGLSKLRQYLILALRMLAVAALILVIGRPLAGGLLGLTGGAPDSVIVLLDRSASMEQKLLSTGTSKRVAALHNLTEAIEEAYGARSKLTLIDSATLEPTAIENAKVLPDLPQTGPTDTAADVPALMQAGLDFITANRTGRTDLWLVSDLRQAGWNVGGGRWKALREALASLEGVRLHLLAYSESPEADLGIVVEKTARRETADGAELLIDLRIRRSEPVSEPLTVPVRVVVNGLGSALDAVLQGDEVLLQAQAIPIDGNTKRGWGRVELPADANPADNVFHFVFGEPPPLKSVIVSEAEEVAVPLQAALSAAADPARSYDCAVLPPGRAAEIVWDETSLVVWQAPIPPAESAAATQLEAQVRAGRALLFLPPETPGQEPFEGVRWGNWRAADGAEPLLPEWWRTDAGLLAHTRAGTALPAGELEVQRWCELVGEGVPLARFGEDADRAPLLLRTSRESQSGAYFLTTWPGPGASSLARDGVVLFALLHRALQDGSASLGNAVQREAAAGSLGDDPSDWTRVDLDDPALVSSIDRPLQSGVLERAGASGDTAMLVALNRAPDEDAPQVVARSSLEEMFDGLDWRLHERTLENEKSLTNEVWRTFLMIMAAALILEALLCMPGRSPKESRSPMELWKEAA
ncbi:MAG TPA: BatA domain-containing protein [Verrucomicrobiales bacterium]|nr:BatA domain-containing protein [Verrucomicrobiales bacterium]